MGGAVPVVIVFLLHKKAYARRGVHIALTVLMIATARTQITDRLPLPLRRAAN